MLLRCHLVSCGWNHNILPSSSTSCFFLYPLYISVHSKKKDLNAIQFLGKDLRYSKQKMALFLKKQS